MECLAGLDIPQTIMIVIIAYVLGLKTGAIAMAVWVRNKHRKRQVDA